MRKGSVRNRTFAIRAGSVVSHPLILFLENPFATPNQLFRLRRSMPAEELQRLGLQLVGGHEEFFELFLDLGRQVPHALQLTLAVRIRRDRDDAIIADLLMLGFLYRLQHANELASQHQARRGRGVMNDHCVQRIAILGSSRWDEAPVVGIGQAEHQRLGQNESLELGIECDSPVPRAAFRPRRGRVHARPRRVASRDLASRFERASAARCAASAAPYFPRTASFMPPTALRIFPPTLSAFPSPSSFLSPIALPAISLTLPLAC